MAIGKIIGLVGVGLLFVFVFVAAKNFLDAELGPVVSAEGANEASVTVTGEKQTVALSVKNFNYYPNTLYLKYNVPAEIVVDLTKVKGCLQSIVIPDFGVRKVVREGDNVIRFVPNKKGTFRFSCSMGMGFGKIVVG